MSQTYAPQGQRTSQSSPSSLATVDSALETEWGMSDEATMLGLCGIGLDDEQRAADLADFPDADAYLDQLVADPMMSARDLLWSDFYGRAGDWRRVLRLAASLAAERSCELPASDPLSLHLFALPEELALAEMTLSSPGALLPDEEQRLLDGIIDDERLATTSRFIEDLYGEAAPAVAERLHALAKAKAPQGQDGQRYAEGVYSKAMPAALTEDDIAAARAEYRLTLSLPVDGQTIEIAVQTPYHISSRDKPAGWPSVRGYPSPAVQSVAVASADRRARDRVSLGKGSGDDIEQIMQSALDANTRTLATQASDAYRQMIQAGATEEDAVAAAGAAVTQWMSVNNVGVDCSGFVFHAVLDQDMQALAHTLDAIGTTSGHYALMDQANVKRMTDPSRATPIPAQAARVGDYVRNEDSEHIGVVESGPRDALVSDIADSATRERVAAALRLPKGADAAILEVGIAHSVDNNGPSRTPDAPGPHLGVYWYHSTTGRLLGSSDPNSGSLSYFFRPLIAPPQTPNGAATSAPKGP